MNEHDLSAGLRALHQERTQIPDPPGLHRRVLALPFDDIPQRRSWLPQLPKWRFQSMFSATKFLVAGAIVALFGGFLLSGVLTQQPSDERLPAVGASASATAQAEPTEAATTEPEPTSEVEADGETTTFPDLLPGVDLVTEEVEPGVYRVLSDGVRELSAAPRSDLYVGGALDRNVVAGPGGSVWLFWPDESFRLGDADSRRWGRDPLPWTDDDVEIAPDGTALRVSGGLRYREPDSDWQSTGYPRSFLDIEVGPEGRLWGVWPNPYRCPKNGVGFKGGCASYVSRLDLRSGDDTIGRPSPGFKDYRYAGLVGFWATDDGSLWLWDRWAGRGENERNSVVKISGTEFDRIKLPVQMRRTRQWMTLADMNGDGVLWAKYGTDPLEPSLARFDGTEWRLFGKGDGVPLMGGHYQGHRGFLAVAPDGSVWVNPYRQAEESDGCDGLATFDGRNWSAFLERQCIFSMDISPDGSVWVQATGTGIEPWDLEDIGDSPNPIHLYVITPEAVAGTE